MLSKISWSSAILALFLATPVRIYDASPVGLIAYLGLLPGSEMPSLELFYLTFYITYLALSSTKVRAILPYAIFLTLSRLDSLNLSFSSCLLKKMRAF